MARSYFARAMPADPLALAPPTPRFVRKGSRPTEPGEDIRGQTIRLPQPMWRTLRILAAEQGTTNLALIREALNALFTKHGKPPVP